MKKTTLIVLLLILCGLLCCCSVNAYTYPDGNRYTAGGAAVTGRVEKLDVSWIDGSVTIAYHDGSDVRLSESSARHLDKKDELRWWLNGGTLYVKYAESGFHLSTNLNKELTVLLPRDMQLDTLAINAVSANVRAEAAVERFTLNTVSGNVVADASRMESVKADAVSGNVTLEAVCAEHVTVNTVSGDVTLRCARAPRTVTADAVSGNVTIALPEDAGCTADMHTVSGRIRGSLDLTRNGDRYTCGDGYCRIDVETVSGDVCLDALK